MFYINPDCLRNNDTLLKGKEYFAKNNSSINVSSIQLFK